FRSHYSCVPLVAGGDTVGALFLEPDKESIVDVTVLRAAADRVALSLAVRHGQPYSVVAIDVDGLKNVNDTFGHEQGDLALRGLANTMRKTLRSSDVGVRTGGDEFLVLMAQSGLEESRVAAERVREAVELQGRTDPKIAISVSAGVAAWQP